jgi:glycosyltransferase involved in cell wall biosynthesis
MNRKSIKIDLISVWIITYNQNKYIRRAIESVLAQTGDIDFEIVISDDGSRDNLTHREKTKRLLYYPCYLIIKQVLNSFTHT